VGGLCFSRGEQRFSVAEKSWTLIMRFSAGLENPGLKPVLSGMNRFVRWTEVQLPPDSGVDDICGLFPGSHAGSSAQIGGESALKGSERRG
jgi:hypothetical protein